MQLFHAHFVPNIWAWNGPGLFTKAYVSCIKELSPYFDLLPKQDGGSFCSRITVLPYAKGNPLGFYEAPILFESNSTMISRAMRSRLRNDDPFIMKTGRVADNWQKVNPQDCVIRPYVEGECPSVYEKYLFRRFEGGSKHFDKWINDNEKKK
jgi:hypothetical protein